MPRVSLDTGSLYYERRGSGPPLVFIHGGWQDSTSWAEQVERFAEEYTVITYDIRGHGETGATAASEYSIELFTDDLEALVAALGLERPILVGISVGGLIASSYLGRHPEAVRGAVVAGPFQSMPSVVPFSDLNPLFSPVQGVKQMAATLGSAGAFRSMLNAMRAANGGRWLSRDRDVRAETVTTARAVPESEYSKIFEAMYDAEPVDLSGVETPLLVLYGADETGRIKRQGRRLADDAHHGRWLELPDAAHLVNRDNPAAFNEACAEFFGTLGG
ncbi:alpha/beta fold hydrolase [Halovenus sp. WSH3]|uniref:Alpha/beta fold hydrolase n=1 Tax=Halovenus carboxidivorans TaxID=2692199 RepID=A0A6B0T5T9_9EURY|nr:alpha/beta hydrolase [Halovenus carboxidivorans]MXR50250.1 alpha/beta fold hydrolase [Halovenus carboxidivorans]